MSAMPDARRAAPSAPTLLHARLDSLTAGDYDRVVLVREASRLARTAPGGPCEILAAIDQYFRRGKIRTADYQQLKDDLGGLLVNAARDARGSGSPPQRHDPTPVVDITAPVLAVPPAVESTGRANSTAMHPRSGDEDGSGVPTAVHAERYPAVGDTLRGRYRVVAVIGRGGMGTIFEVDDLYLSGIAARDRRLAVKMLHTEVAQRPDLLRELLTEFLNLRSLSHPNILRVHDFDHDGGQAFFTMELLRGTSLGNVISVRGAMPLALDHARTIVHAVGMALAHAHSHGIVHGDITPQNIFLARDGDVRILDFGASRRLQREPTTAEGSSVDEAESQPRLAATRRYASCEVLEGCTAEMSDDLFGLACVAYVLLTGDHPFGNRTAIEARANGRKPVRPRGLSARQWRVLRQGLDLRRDHRPSDVGRWVRRLNSGALIRPLPMLCDLFAVRIVRHGKWTAAAVAVALGLLAAGGYGWRAHEDSLRSFAATVRADAAAILRAAHDRVRVLLE